MIAVKIAHAINAADITRSVGSVEPKEMFFLSGSTKIKCKTVGTYMYTVCIHIKMTQCSTCTWTGTFQLSSHLCNFIFSAVNYHPFDNF